MRYGCLLALFILFSQISTGQLKTSFVPKRYAERYNQYGDRYKYYFENDSTLGIPSLQKSLHIFHFRLSCYEYYLDVWTDNLQDYNGQIKVVAYNEKEKRYHHSEALTPQTAKEIYYYLQQTKVFSIPSSEKIDKWEESTDCDSYNIEQSTSTCYVYKEYACPDGNLEKLVEANIISNLKAKIYVDYVGPVWEPFFKSLPKGCYKTAGVLGRCN